MRRYLLLFVMSLACIIGMQAKITVVPPEESTSGAYELIFSDGDATATGEYASMADLPNYVKNATSITIKTAEGYLLSNNEDDGENEMELLMGGDNKTTLFPNLQSLDMGDAVLEENGSLARMSYAKGENAKGLTNLTSFTFPKTTTSIPAGAFNENTTLQEVIMLEGSLTTITDQAFQNCTSLSRVRIPDGVTSIGANAFEHCAFEAISFPNTLTRIGNNAFNDCSMLKSVTIPASVTSIGTSAFQHNYSMTDVYVLGNNVTIPNGAFNENETYNFKYEDDGDGIVEYEDWGTNNPDASPHPLRLHVPDTPEAKSNYINPCLQALNDPRMTDEILSNVGGNYNFIAGILEEYGVTNYGGFIWDMGRYVVMDGRRYFTDGNNKFNLEGAPVVTNLYGGWRNFMLAAADVEKKIWPDDRMVDSRWYSAVFPFDLSYNQLLSAYGEGTDVREFTGVTSVEDGTKTKLTVTFNQRVAVINNDRDATYIVKGHPYMIHPGVRSYNGEGQPATRYIAGISKEEAQKVIGDVEGFTAEETGTVTVGDYTFKGTYQDDNLPQYCYYLGMYPNDLSSLKFYYTKTAGTTKKNWTQFTSIVKVSESLGANGAKSMDMDFSIFNQNVFNDNYGIATSIEKAQTEREFSDRIYNLNGQVIGKGSLQSMPKGIYVVNGKKIVVR